ncbi:MAG: winged helix-turn-helix domain-containing protein [Acidobacteriia bacterium]|nr:winged helix-turn-helix domain-containing protein [Terriglobia bacterium]
MQPSLNRVSHGPESAALQPRFMDLLVYLAQHAGKVVSKDEILDAVWGKEFVSEGTLTHAVAVIRQALGDDVRSPAYIETIPTRGYRLVAQVSQLAGSEAVPGTGIAPTRGRRTRFGLAMLLAGVLVILGVVAWLVLRWPQGPYLGPEGRGGLRIVVMPFQNLGPAASEYMALGITDDITTRLASIHGVVVSSRTSAAYCAKAGRSARQIADELGVGLILEGSVRWETDQSSGESLRVNAQLIRAKDDTLLWGQSYRTDISSVVEVGAVIAREAIQELGVPVRGAEQSRLAARPTENPDAYQAFLCGMRYHDLDGREQMGLAVSMFDRAVKLDPAFGLAYAELAVTHSRIYHSGIDTSPVRLAKAEQAARRALELSPELPEAHLALGAIQHLGHRDFARALEDYKIAARSLPNDSELFALIADVHRRQGRWTEARREIERVVDLDPSNTIALLALGDTLGCMRAYAEADRAFQRASNVSPDRNDPYLRRFWNYLQWEGSVDRAERVLSEVPLPDDSDAIVCHSYLKYLRRDFKGAVEALSRTSADAQLRPFLVGSRELLECLYLDAAGDRPGATQACTGVLAGLEHDGVARPDEPWVQLAAARASAAVGRKEEAIRLAQRAVTLLSISSDAYDGPNCMTQQAEVLARTGEVERAAAVLEQLLSIPSMVSPAWLRLDPAWDPLRGHGRFQALVGAQQPPPR